MSLLLPAHLGLDFLEFFLGMAFVAAATLGSKAARFGTFSSHPTDLHEAWDALTDPVALSTDAGKGRALAARLLRYLGWAAWCEPHFAVSSIGLSVGSCQMSSQLWSQATHQPRQTLRPSGPSNWRKLLWLLIPAEAEASVKNVSRRRLAGWLRGDAASSLIGVVVAFGVVAAAVALLVVPGLDVDECVLDCKGHHG